MPFQNTKCVQYIITVSALALLAACSSESDSSDRPFLAFGDEEIHIRADMHSSKDDSIAITAWVCSADLSVCGERKMDETVYQPDRFRFSTPAGASAGLYFASATGPYAKKSGRVVAGILGGELIGFGREGMIVNVDVNDLPRSTTFMPPFLKVTLPKYNEQISRSTAASARVEWEPSGKDFPIFWRRLSNYAAHGTRPCDALAWPKSEGETVDSAGFIDIPLDAFPTEIPAEGCDLIIVLERRSVGTLGAGIKGYIQGNAMSGIKYRLMP